QGALRMIAVRRLMAVGTILSLAVVFVITDVRGGRTDGHVARPATKVDERFSEEAGPSRFADSPVLVYKTKEGKHLLALQVKPKLPDAPARPRDYVVLIDTSASMAMGPLVLGQTIIQEMVKKLGPDDRLSLWTAN